jgi:tRNA pseudouridine55 synthase
MLIDKDEGKTSFDVVRELRRLLKVKKVGHAGTLDPFATGLLIILLGQGTKLSSFLMVAEKIYLATMRLGIETDTQDLTGQVVQTRPVPDMDPAFIRRVASGFVGEIEQVPPPFSALKYRGKRAYEFAREGIKVNLQKRTLKIHSLEITSVDLPDVTIKVSCSSGTYMRSLGADLGKALGPGAHLTALRRLGCGPFEVKDAFNLKTAENLPRDRLFQEKIIPLRQALPHIRESQVDERIAQRIRNGYQPQWEEVFGGGDLPDFFEGYMKFVKRAELVAIAKGHYSVGEDGELLRIVRVFNKSCPRP